MYAEVAGQTVVLGVTSRGVRPAKTNCGEGGIYVQLDAVRPWIEAQTGLTFAAPDCEGLGLNVRPRPQNLSHEGVYERTIRGKLLPGDEASDQTHRLEVCEPPQYGTVEIKPSGRFVYRPHAQDAEAQRPEQDVWWVRVTDSGDPQFAGYAKVTLRFEEAQGLCTAGAVEPFGWWWVLAAGLWGCSRKKRNKL